MLLSVKKEFKLQFANLWPMMCVMFGLFCAGEVIVAIIMRGSSKETGATLGWMFALMGYAFWLFVVGIQLNTGLENSITMSRTRKSYLFAHYVVNLAYSAVMALWALLLGNGELLLYRTFWPGREMEIDLSKFYTPTVILLMIVAGVIVASFFGAIIARFGRKAFWVLWAVWMFTFLVLPRMASSRADSPTVLSRIGEMIAAALANVPLSVWKVLGVFFLCLSFFLTLVLTRKKGVSN